MIIESLMNLMTKFISLIFIVVNIPGLPEEFVNALDKFTGYLSYADGLIGLFFPVNLEPFFIVWSCIFSFDHGYPIIMWILRKIPFFGIK